MPLWQLFYDIIFNVFHHFLTFYWPNDSLTAFKRKINNEHYRTREKSQIPGCSQSTDTVRRNFLKICILITPTEMLCCIKGCEDSVINKESFDQMLIWFTAFLRIGSNRLVTKSTTKRKYSETGRDLSSCRLLISSYKACCVTDSWLVKTICCH